MTVVLSGMGTTMSICCGDDKNTTYILAGTGVWTFVGRIFCSHFSLYYTSLKPVTLFLTSCVYKLQYLPVKTKLLFFHEIHVHSCAYFSAMLISNGGFCSGELMSHLDTQVIPLIVTNAAVHSALQSMAGDCAVARTATLRGFGQLLLSGSHTNYPQSQHVVRVQHSFCALGISRNRFSVWRSLPVFRAFSQFFRSSTGPWSLPPIFLLIRNLEIMLLFDTKLFC